jgi:hypothetical protein
MTDVDLRASSRYPGRVYAEVNGQTIAADMKNVRDAVLYDTVELANGAQSEGKTYHFFRDIDSKDLVDTNITTARRLATGEKMKIFQIGVYIPNYTGNKQCTPPDFLKILDNAFLSVKLNKQLIAEGPVVTFPSGFGPTGALGVEGAATGPASRVVDGVLTNGVPATKMMYNLLKPQDIWSEFDIDASLTFYARDWLTSAGYSSDEMPTLAGYPTVKLFLRGLLWGVA